MGENGNELPGGEKTIVIKNGKVGSYYFTTGKDFDGYTFSHMSEDSANATGKVIELSMYIQRTILHNQKYQQHLKLQQFHKKKRLQQILLLRLQLQK